MKWLLIAILISSGYTLLSQDSCSVIEAEADRFTGNKSWGAKEKIIVAADKLKQGISVYVFNHSEHPYIIMVMTGASGKFKCVDKGDTLNVIFRDGSKVDMINQGKSNCDGKFSLYFGDLFGKLDELNQLISKPIEAVRIWGRGESIAEDFTTKNSSDVMQVLSCLKAKW